MKVWKASDVDKWEVINQKCKQILAATDKYVSVPDYPITEEEKAAWIKYRQAIRDLNKIYTNPDEVIWPTPPGNIE